MADVKIREITSAFTRSVLCLFLSTVLQISLTNNLIVGHTIETEDCSTNDFNKKIQHLQYQEKYLFIYEKCNVYVYPMVRHYEQQQMRSMRSASTCPDPNSHWNSTTEECTCNHAYFMDGDVCSPCVPCCPDDVQVVHACVQQDLEPDICKEVPACTPEGSGEDISWLTVILGIGAALIGFMILLATLLFLILHRERLQMRWRRLRDRNERTENDVTPNTTTEQTEDVSPDLANFMPTTNNMDEPNDSTV